MFQWTVTASSSNSKEPRKISLTPEDEGSTFLQNDGERITLLLTATT